MAYAMITVTELESGKGKSCWREGREVFVCFFLLLRLLFYLLSDFLDFDKLMLHNSTVSHFTSKLAFDTFLSPR